MTVSEANAIINSLRAKYDFGLLEMLEIMTDEQEAGGISYMQQTYTLEERQAYWVLMNGFRNMFEDKTVSWGVMQ